MRSMFVIKERDVLGRIGRLKVPRGLEIETPYIFPVIDYTRQELPVKEIKEIGFNGVITNAYLLYRRGVTDNVRKVIGAGNDTVVMTDSGAYQLLEYGEVYIDNTTVINYQKKIGSDIAVILDVPTGNTSSRDEALSSVKTTLSRAREALKHIDRERLWVLPIQGGPYTDVLRLSIKESRKFEVYDIYALGSPTRLLESYAYDKLVRMILMTRRNIQYDKPLHLFGAGHPMFIPFAVALGVDLFDSASYILFARDDRYMMEGSTKKLSELRTFPCNCPVCSRYTPQELLEMGKEERTRLLAKHNLYVIKKVIEETKQAIHEGRLWELLEEYARKHPTLWHAFKHISKYSNVIARYSPIRHDSPKALYYYGKTSLNNPLLTNARSRIINIIKQYLSYTGLKKIYIVHRCIHECHGDLNLSKRLVRDLCKTRSDCMVFILIADETIVPLGLERAYPFGHIIYSSSCGFFSVKRTLTAITRFLGNRSLEIELMIPDLIADKYKKTLGGLNNIKILREQSFPCRELNVIKLALSI